MAVTYQKAPISELICGVIFTNNILAHELILFELLFELKDEYPDINTQPPIFEEEIQDYKVFSTINTTATGFSLYRLSSADKKFMIQIQQNLVLVNWIRTDDQKVGSYPGFPTVYKRFKDIFSRIEQKLGKYIPDVDIYKHIKNFTLHYQDRVFYNNYINDLADLEKITNLKTPIITGADAKILPANNIFSKYTTPVKEINGYSIISINTGVSRSTNQQILIVECRLKGKFDGKIDEWFNNAHSIQLAFFETFFKPNILDEWKQ